MSGEAVRLCGAFDDSAARRGFGFGGVGKPWAVGAFSGVELESRETFFQGAGRESPDGFSQAIFAAAAALA